VKQAFDREPFYNMQLFSKESAVLQAAYQQASYCDTYGKMRSYILHDVQLDTADHKLLGDLVDYEFLGVVGSLSQDTTTDKQHPHYYIRDAPLAMLAALKGGRNTLPSAAGLRFEDMVRHMIKDSLSKELKVFFGDWREKCTEIDFVAVSKANKTVYWGSDKLNAAQQDYLNHLAHIVSYFNNRLWQNQKYFRYRHVMLFISVQEDNKHRFDDKHEEMNQILSNGRSTDLEKLCRGKLSNYNEGGEPFAWYEPKKAEDTGKGGSGASKKQEKKKATITSPPPTTPITTTATLLPANNQTPDLATTTAATTTTPITTPTHPLPMIVTPPLFATPKTPSKKEKPRKEPVDPSAYFVIDKCVALDLSDLVDGVNLEEL